MVAEAKGRMFRRKDGKYFLYLPRNLVEDSAFPFTLESSVPVHVAIDHSRQKLLVMPVKQKPKQDNQEISLRNRN